MGGFQVMEWALRYPGMVRSAICIASAPRLSTQAIAFNTVGRSAITRDPGWNEGQYNGKGPEQGLATARMVGHITYVSEMLLDAKLGRRLQSADRLRYNFSSEFAIESYLNHQGSAFTRRFDANSYLYITYSTDWLFPTAQSLKMVRALLTNGKNVSFIEVDSTPSWPKPDHWNAFSAAS